MQGEELIFLISLLVILPLFMTRMILNHKKWKHSIQQKGEQSELETRTRSARSFVGRARERRKRNQEAAGDNSLTVTELEGMIRAAVSDVTEPMQERLQDMERQLHTLRESPLDLAPDYEDEQPDAAPHEALDKTLGRRRQR